MSTTEHDLDRSDIDAADVDVVADEHDAAEGDERSDAASETSVDEVVDETDAADDELSEQTDVGTDADNGDVAADVEHDDGADAVEAVDVEHDQDVDDDGVGDGDSDDSAPIDLPEIVMVSEVDEADDDARIDGDDIAIDAKESQDGDDDEYVVPDASPDVLEELRRADIDGPMVEVAPQDDGTNARRRPKRSADYDPAPIPIPLRVPRVLGRKPRVRKVTRVVRHVDPWSVFKIAAIAHLVLYAIVMTAGVLLWNVAYATGTVENIERFFESFGWSSFEFNGGEIYHAAWIAGLFAVLGLTGLAVLGATLFNLITDLVGGARITVLEEEVVESRSTPMRRFVVRRPEPEVPAVIHDASGTITREAIPDESSELPR